MRTLRLSMAGTLILALLGGLGGAVLAQDEAETAQEVSRETTVFEGTMLYQTKFEDGTKEPVFEERMTKWRDRGWVSSLEDVSDPRLAGTITQRVNGHYYGDAIVDAMIAATRVENADGSWLGHLTGYHDSAGTSTGNRWHWQGILKGTDAYEGLTALVFMSTREGVATQGYDVHGMVFPGELPEVPEYPEPAE